MKKLLYLISLFSILSLIFYLVSCENGLVAYQASNLKGYKNKPVLVDYYFVDCMKRINNYARENDLTLYVTSSFRKQNQKITGNIVTPALKSNHLVGHAIDINIVCNGKWYDSRKMRRSNLHNLPQHIQNFFNCIRKDRSLRWGGDFSTQDPVHIDDNFNKNNNPWLQRYRQLQT